MSLDKLLLNPKSLPFKKLKLPPKHSYITTDESISYIFSLLNEKKEENPKDGFTVTNSVSYDAKDNLQLSSQAELLANSYYEILNLYKIKKYSRGYIYTVANVASNIKDTVSHQNWFCLDTENKTLLRFEPSREYEEFRYEEFCCQVLNNLEKKEYNFNYKLVQEGQSICVFSGCRAFSTLLAIMHVKGKDMNRLIKVSSGINPTVSQSQSFNFIVRIEESLRNMSCPRVTFNRKSSRGKKSSSLGFVLIE